MSRLARSSRHRLFWSVYARAYDSLWDTPHLREVSAQIDSALPVGAPVLEVGAGTGIVASHLARSGRPVVGCEPSKPMADHFARRLPSVPLIRAGLADLTRAPASHVVAVNLLHLLEDPTGGLCRLREICGPGRLVVVVTPDPKAGLLDVAAAQRRFGVHPLQVARFVIWHILLAPVSILCGMPTRVRLDWYRGIEAPPDEPRPVGDVYLMLVLPGSTRQPCRAGGNRGP